MFEFPNIDPVAFSIGPFAIRWYALAYLAGFLIGWRYAMKLAGFDPQTRPTPKDIDDFLPWVIGGVILGGRLGYVLFYHFDYYMDNPVDIFKLWHGGMSFHGGALGVILMLLIWPHIHRIPHLRIADIVCASVPIGLFFGRIALEKPSFVASFRRLSLCETDLTSPDRLISPNTTVSSGRAFCERLDMSAAATARSAAGSDILSPPATFRYTSHPLRPRPARASSTASTMARRPESQPTTALLGLAAEERATSA